MAEHGKFPSVMETIYEVPHHMGLQQQDGDKKVEHGTIPSTMAAIGVEHGDICTNISPTTTCDEMPQLPCEESHHHMSNMSDSTTCDIERISYERMSVTTTSPTHESMPHNLCEVERHLSDSTNHMSESILEGVSEPQHFRE